MALISAATCISLGVGTSAETAALTIWCNNIDAAIKDYCGYDIEQATYPGAGPTNGKGDSGFYTGLGTRYLVLRHRPVLITGLTVYQDMSGRFGTNPDGAFDSSTTVLTYGTDYTIQLDGYSSSAALSRTGILERINGVWPSLAVYQRGRLVHDEQPQRGNVKVAYTAGYSSVPPAITQAAALWVAHIRRIQAQGGGIQSEGLGSYNYSMVPIQWGMPDEVRLLLSKYRNRPV